MVSENGICSVVLKGRLLDDGASDSRWHSVKVGEIFYTDGISRKEYWRHGSFFKGSY